MMLFLHLGLGGCLTVGADQAQTLERTLTAERSPDFSEDQQGHLDVEATDLLPLDGAVLACSEDGMSLSWLDDAGDVAEEWLESSASKGSEHAVSCSNLDLWGDRVAVSAQDRVRLYEIYAAGDEPDWWESFGQAGPLGWSMDILEAAGEPLGEVVSTTYNNGLERGYIATCCDRREVLETDAEADAWERVQLVPDEEEPPERLALTTGLVNGERYLFGAGGDKLYAAALDGGPALTMPEAGGFFDGDPVQVRLVDSDLLWVGAGDRGVLYTLAAGAERWELLFDSGDASLLDVASTSGGGVDDYAYVAGEGVVITAVQTRAPCTQSDRDGHAYLFCGATLAWTDAKSKCRDYGAFDLVQIDGENENDWVAERSTDILGANAWIGLSDRDREGEFVWSTEAPLDSDAWEPGEPNDSAGDEDCVELYETSGTWNDADCAIERAYVCESIN